MKQTGIKLSVVMMAYNQAEYIDEAIQSVFNQELPFEWELIIGDDASTDNTPVSVKKWLDKYPDNIIYIQRPKNIGLNQNYIHCVNQTNGKYIALLEADDYWIDKKKTIRQINLMEQNPNLSWTFTDGVILNIDGGKTEQTYDHLPEMFSLEYYLKNFFNPLNNTIIFRKSCEPIEYPFFFLNIIQWDTVLHYLRGRKGDVGYVSVKGLAWRRHEKATSISTNYKSVKRFKDWIVINKEIKTHLPEKLHKYFNQNYKAYEFIAIYYLRQRKWLQFFRYAVVMFFSKPNRTIKDYRDFLWKVRNGYNKSISYE